MARQDIYFSERIVDLFHVFIILQTLQHYTPSVIAVENHNQAFIQTDKHLTYIVGDNYISSGVPLEIKPGSSFSDLSLGDDNYFSNNIRLDPPMLDFQAQPVGMPRMENVKVQNNDPNNNLHLLSISGSTVHFHCSFFQDKIVPPGGNTSFDVVFLARQVGNVENTLYIHTSKGSIRYQVFGVGVPNPYRLRPYLGARVPVNSSYTPLIQMHNPHSTRLQVLEMFTSEGDLHLELPSGEREAMRELWELQPFETKAVMRAHFIGRVENNHTAFIRIRTTKESFKDPPQLLVLPLEVEVSSEPGLYSPTELLDFGILRTLDEPKVLRLSLINTGPKIIHIVNVTVSPPNDAVTVEFRPFKLRPDNKPIFVAHISFQANKALLSKQWTGKILIKTKGNTHNLIVPYQANVLHGSLAYLQNMTHFFSGKELWNISRPMLFTNTFSFPLVIFNVSLPPDVATYFSIDNFQPPVIVHPQQKATVFVLKFHPNKTQIHFNTMLTLCTNASTFRIPIVVYNGLMKVIHHRPEKFEGQLDFGTLGIGERNSMIFTIRNDNPIDIVMAHFEINMTWASIEVLGMEKGNGTTLTHKHNKSEINTDPLCIKPYHYAVFNVSILAPEKEGAHAADIWMFTQFQDLFIPIVFRAAKGSLHAIPDKIVFVKVYPGRVPYKILQIRSTFDDYMEVTAVSFQPADVRFYFVPQNGNAIVLQPHEQNVVGKIYFDPKRLCGDDCYVGIPLLSPAGHQWLLGMALDKDVADTDQYLYTKLRQKWDKINQLQQDIANVTIELDTNQVRGFLFSAQAHLHWPSLVRKSKIMFPLTQIGNISVSDFIVENPGNELVLVQILPLSLYPNTHSVIDLVRDRLYNELPDFIDTEDTTSFVLYDLEPFSKMASNGSNIYQLRKTVENTLGVIPHRGSLATLLQPGQKIRVKIGFKPKDEISRSSLIVVRNNLTIVDAVVVQGEGSYGDMRFSSRKPGSNSPLTFEMTEKHLKNCDISERKSTRNMLPNFTVRRSFTLRNTGDLPFYVHGFSISDWPCEGYGFKVLECSGFEMLPNTSRKVNIAFTPDFTMSQIQRVLTVHTSLGPPSAHANYSLQAMVPYDLLSHCSAALPRPGWEPLLYYFVVCLVMFIICCIMVLAYFESDRVTADYLRKRLKVTNGTQTFERGKVFDLRNLNGVGNIAHHCNSQPSAAVGNDSWKVYMANHGSCTNGISHMYTNGIHDRVKANGQPMNQYMDHHMAHQGTVSSYKKRSFLQSLQHFIKSIFAFKLFRSRKRTLQPTTHQSQAQHLNFREQNITNSMNAAKTQQTEMIQKQSSVPESLNHTTGQVNQPDIPSASEKPIQNSISCRQRKGKLNNKKQLVADHGDASPSSELTRKTNSNKKDSYENDRKNSTPTVKPLEEHMVAKTSSLNYNQIDDFDDYEAQLNSHRSKMAKRSNKKSKSKTKSEPIIDKFHQLVHESLFSDEVDEVSSTTTESSGGDIDDKSLGHDITSDITIITTDITGASSVSTGNKWKKGGLVVATHGDELVDDDSNFELTSKSKAHRKIRIDKETYGGDIMKPDTYDLPYTLKEKDKPEKASKKLKKVKKHAKVTAPIDFSEFSIPSENFALKHRRLSSPSNSPNWAASSPTMTTNQGAKASLTNSNSLPLASGSSALATNYFQSIGGGNNLNGRNGNSSSYSSIVSSNSGSTYNALADLPSSVGLLSKNLSKIQDKNSGNIISSASSSFGLPSSVVSNGFGPASFAPFSESNYLPGIVSDLTSAKSTYSPSNNWNIPAMRPDSMSTYNVHDTSNPRNFGMVQSMDGSIYSGNDQLYGMCGPGVPDTSGHPMTMMQQLQAERRRRLYEHQQKVSKGEDWPGFNTPLVRNDCLWDPDYKPVENMAWSTASDNPVTGNSLWSTLTNSASSGWSSLQSLANIWGNQPERTNQDVSNQLPVGYPPSSTTPPSQTIQLTNPPFNPFTSMADIWSPKPTQSASLPPSVQSTQTSVPTTGLGGSSDPLQVNVAIAAAAPGGPVSWMSSGSTPPPPPSPGVCDPIRDE